MKGLGFLALVMTIGTASATAASDIAINDNRRPAGVAGDHTLTINLRAAIGAWRPEGHRGPALTTEAFGEEGSVLQVPAPLLRVRQGTQIRASVRNTLDVMLRVHGLCTRDGSAPCAPLEIPPGERRDVQFAAGLAGTYHYWATTTAMPLAFRAAGDTQLSGAFIVDPADSAPETDRVLVLTDWTNVTRAQLRELALADDPGTLFYALNPRYTFLVNGLSWPATERLEYHLNDRVRWRVVNLSSQVHPMHLHGFYFDVETLGDGTRETASAPGARPHVVTQILQPGATMTMAWRAERAGNWLFHCHIADHVSPQLRLGEAGLTPRATSDGVEAATVEFLDHDGMDHGGHHAAHDVSAGMAGLVVGITIVDPERTAAGSAPSQPPARTLTLEMRTGTDRYRAAPAYGFALVSNGEASASHPIEVPGPTLALRRGEPVEITLVNHLPDATAIHWHGMELESYYDGVHGWSGAGSRVTPMIEPGQSFTVRFTPPRTGTFIYHTHLHDGPQLTSGMYGALIVLEPGETFDPALDHVVVIGRSGPARDAAVLLNGDRSPQFAWKAGARHRIRLVNITPNDIFVVSLMAGERALDWQPLTKDGAPVPAGSAQPRTASITIAVGETYDFAYDAPPGRQTVWMNVRTPAGRWQVQGRVGIK
jgi:manganese oxidase